MSRGTCVLRTAVSSCTPLPLKFAAFVPDEHANRKFRNDKNIRLAKIHRVVAEVFGEGSVRKWYRLFEASRYNVHDEKQSGPRQWSRMI